MVNNGRTGWYFRVLTPEWRLRRDHRHRVRDPAGVTVAMVHAARLSGADRGVIERAASVDALSRCSKQGSWPRRWLASGAFSCHAQPARNVLIRKNPSLARERLVQFH